MQENKEVFKVQNIGFRDLIIPHATKSATIVTKTGNLPWAAAPFMPLWLACAAYGEQHKGADKFQAKIILARSIIPCFFMMWWMPVYMHTTSLLKFQICHIGRYF